MRLESNERRPRTLVGRVALVAGLAAVIGGFFAAITAVGLAEMHVEQAEDRRLQEEALEIVSEAAELAPQDLEKFLVEEHEEFERLRLRFALHRDGVLLGGDPNLRDVSSGCATIFTPTKMRMCGATKAKLRCIVVSNDVPTLGGSIVVGIILGSAVLAALLGALTSGRLATWAVGPLARLGVRLGNAPMDKVTDLGPDEGVREIDTLRKTLRELLDRRAEALRAARLFAAGAAHELRTPLTTLSGELDLLAEDALPGQLRERIEGLRESTARIVKLVERLLVLARVGAADAMRLDAVELSDVAAEVCRRASRGAAERLTYEARAMPIVRGDESLLSVLCENAVSNALLHAAPGQVRVLVDEREGDVFFEVMDEGPGIDARDRVRLFEPFQRGTGSGQGAGLGLALVGQIARAHGGEAQFVQTETEKETHKGAHLRVRLPRWTPQMATPSRALENGE